MKAYITLQQAGSVQPLGALHMELYYDKVPKTVQNFITLLQRPAGRGYLQSSIHRIIPGFMAQGGDFTSGDGTGGESIYGGGGAFADENFLVRHTRPGMLSMANAGPDTNTSQFFITFRATPHLDGKHVVFGHIDLTKSADVLDALERVRTGVQDRPKSAITIVKCGLEGGGNKEASIETSIIATDNADEAEIDLDEEEVVVEEEEDPPSDKSLTKAEAMKLRLRKLKQKMNQARQLNRQAVREEGERITPEGATKARKRQAAKDKKNKEEEFRLRNMRALDTAAKAGIDGKLITEQAADSVYKATTKAARAETQRFSVNDYHNPEGQHRNYLRSIKSLPRRDAAEVVSADIYNPIESTVDPEQELQGAKRLAAELNRRREKSRMGRQKRNRERDMDDSNVSSINKKNKVFNKKINRNYDKATEEIRENLERGTAL